MIFKSTLIAIALLASATVRADLIGIDSEKAQELITAGFTIIDVRRVDEWHNTGVIEGSLLLTFFDKAGRYDAQQWLSELQKKADTTEPMILICHVGGRTSIIGKWLGKQYDTVYHVENGIVEWLQQKRKTVSP